MADASSFRKATSLPSATGRNNSSCRWIDGELSISNGTSWVYPFRQDVVYRATLADGAFYVATRPVKVIAISEVHAVAGDDVGAVNVQVTKDTGTQAPGAGADLLTNNSDAGFNLKGTANTVQAGTLTATEADLVLAAGDRLSLDFAGTLDTLAGVVVTVTIAPV